MPPHSPIETPGSHQVTAEDGAGFGIALDWGTTNLRAFLLDSRGLVVSQREKPWGILCLPASVEEGGFDQALEAIAGDWMAAHPQGALIASGMVGSAQGWREAPYVRCPAGAGDLLLKMTRIATASGRDLMIVPGILFDQEDALPDVIRGEETQVIGALQSLAGQAGGDAGGESADLCFVLPGTHSKWILVKDGRIVQFATYMTGELFANLKQHSILGRLMTAPVGPDAPVDAKAQEAVASAYLQALTLARTSGPGDLMRHLFTVRSMNLAGRLPVAALSDYLSGLLIGHELASATAWLGREAAGNPKIVLIGEAHLLRRYEDALASFGLHASSLQNTAAAGMHYLLNLTAGGRTASGSVPS